MARLGGQYKWQWTRHQSLYFFIYSDRVSALLAGKARRYRYITKYTSLKDEPSHEKNIPAELPAGFLRPVGGG
ncbi:hypothetical protein GCM10022394_01820 [Zobellella aerophila]|uniref:Uncharacterized protein n=1 Tax=Zobellella aerophila TaxID=870480 RepID=A0ABP6V597_9GAMM